MALRASDGVFGLQESAANAADPEPWNCVSSRVGVRREESQELSTLELAGLELCDRGIRSSLHRRQAPFVRGRGRAPSLRNESPASSTVATTLQVRRAAPFLVAQVVNPLARIHDAQNP
jgi:hypothetical protein